MLEFDEALSLSATINKLPSSANIITSSLLAVSWNIKTPAAVPLCPEITNLQCSASSLIVFVPIPIFPLESIKNLFSEFVVSFIAKFPAFTLISKSLLAFVSTRLIIGAVFVMVILPVALIFPVTAIFPDTSNFSLAVVFPIATLPALK